MQSETSYFGTVPKVSLRDGSYFCAPVARSLAPPLGEPRGLGAQPKELMQACTQPAGAVINRPRAKNLKTLWIFH